MFSCEVLESGRFFPMLLSMLAVQSLSCRRGLRLVFRDIAFRLAPGSFLQITGVNGCGKSSLLRVLAGLLPSASGDILWNDSPITSDMDAYRRQLHYVGHLDALKPELAANDMLAFWRALRPGTQRTAEDWFGIEKFRHKPIRYLSAGQKRRVSLSRLTLSPAALWLLDEPTTALDTEGQKLLLQSIEAHRAKSGIVIAAAHHPFPCQGVEIFALQGKS